MSIPAITQNGAASQAGSPRDAAITQSNERMRLQTELTKSGGGKRRKYRGGAQEVTLVPSPLSSPQGAGGTTNDVTMKSMSNITQSTENSTFDNSVGDVKPIPSNQLASQSGGTTTLEPGQPWLSCSSGGKKTRKSKKSKKFKKSNKSKKSKKCKKCKKSKKSKNYKKSKKSKKSRK
jgi:hypothetical protein